MRPLKQTRPQWVGERGVVKRMAARSPIAAPVSTAEANLAAHFTVNGHRSQGSDQLRRIILREAEATEESRLATLVGMASSRTDLEGVKGQVDASITEAPIAIPL